MLKRVVLFLATNLAVIVLISILLHLFGVRYYLTNQGIDYRSLLIFAMIIGFTGSFVSLFTSKFMAKMAYGVQVIDQPGNAQEAWLVAKVQELAKQAGIGMPEVGIYRSPEANAFATGWNRNNALVAVSSGLLDHMDQREVEGVLGHEISHIANGDMVTLTLIQGVVNTFVIFFARIAAYIVANVLRGDDEEGEGISYLAYTLTAILFEILFGILASIVVMYFSRYREFRADAGSARLVGKDRMIAALRKLQRLYELPEDPRGQSFAAMKISNRSKFMKLFATHPPIEERIAALERV